MADEQLYEYTDAQGRTQTRPKPVVEINRDYEQVVIDTDDAREAEAAAQALAEDDAQ